MINDRTHQFLAKGRSWYQRNANAITKITVHHTASTFDGTENEILNSIYKTHNGANGWPGISYHYIYIPKRFKGYSGKVIRLNKDQDVTWHDGVNWSTIGFCIHGYYHPDVNHTLTKEDFAVIKQFLDFLCTGNPQFPADFDDVMGHRDIQQSACPGNYLYPYIKEYRDKKGNVNWGTVESCVKLGDDIPTDIEDKMKLKDYSWYNKNWSLKDLINDSINTHKTLDNTEKLVKDLRREIKNLDTSLAMSTQQNQNLNEVFNNLQKTHGDLQIQYDDLKTQFAFLKSEFDLYKESTKDFEAMKEYIVELQAELERLKNQKYSVTEALNFLIAAIKGTK